MTLEDLIYERLIGPDGPGEKLARFSGRPAVFYQYAPDDTAHGWEGPQYPRIDFVVDMQANPERHTSGQMCVNIWSSEQSIKPEEIEPDVINAFREVFITPDGKSPYSLSWFRSSAYSVGGKYPATTIRKDPDTMVIAIEMIFEVYEFPRQETTDPDPILAINEFAKEFSPDAIIIGKDQLSRFQAATAEHPLIYFRLLSTQSAEETNTIAWMTGVIAGHIFAPEPVRLEWMKFFTDAVSYFGDVTMLDDSPMYIKQAKMNAASDPLTVGQLRLNVRYGLLRRWFAHPLNEVNSVPEF